MKIVSDFSQGQKAKGQSKINNTFEYKAPGTFYCTMLPPSGTETGNEAIKKPNLN